MIVQHIIIINMWIKNDIVKNKDNEETVEEN